MAEEPSGPDEMGGHGWSLKTEVYTPLFHSVEN
jgi:hypothetical protein